jgi:hypothetical protein
VTKTAAPLRSAVYVDFDNIFIGLKNLEGERAAKDFALRPND